MYLPHLQGRGHKTVLKIFWPELIGFFGPILHRFTGLKISQQDFDDRLASVLGSYPALWKRSSPEFKNKAKKEKATLALANVLHSTVPYMLSRIKALREKYRRERIRLNEQTKSGASQVEHDDWHLFNTLSFFDKVMTSRNSRQVQENISTTSSYSSSTNTNSSWTETVTQNAQSSIIEDIFDNEEMVENENMTGTPEVNQVIAKFNLTTDNTDLLHPSSKNKDKQKGKSNKEITTSNDLDSLISMVRRLPQAAESTASSCKNTMKIDDKSTACHSFGKFIAEKLKIMNMLQQQEAMFLIHKVIYDLENKK